MNPADSIEQRFAWAVQQHQAGRLREAEAAYRAVLREAPQHPHALHLLGVVAYQNGRPQEAIDLITRALAVHGPHPVFFSNLSAAYLVVGELDRVVAHCREALRMQPNLTDAHNNLGVALMRQGHFDEAGDAFRAALRCNPRHVDARCNLGAILHRQGNLPEAIALLQETIRLAPHHAQAHNDLGGALLACNQADQAEPHLRQAVRLRPTFAEAHSNLGLCLRDQGRIEEAIASFRESLRLEPAYAGARNNLGYTLEFMGRVDEARAEFKEALRLDPNNPRALASLSGLAAAGHYEFSDDEIQRIGALVRRTDLPLDDLGRLHFALARQLDKAGSYGPAFEHYLQGNDLRKEYVRRRGAVYDPAAQSQTIDRLCATFTPEFFERTRFFGVDSELPIFIVGMMRSGTTLAEQILASHPGVYGAGERSDVEALKQALAERLGGAAGYPECLARLEAPLAQELAASHVQMLRRLGGEAVRVVDKLPFNFLNVGLIATLFPRARIIHCRRDPVDTCLSCFFQNFGEPHGFTLDLRHLGHYYREYERLMAHWTRVLPVPIFELCYEELTANQEALSRQLVAFCGLDWDERCLRFHDTKRPVRTASTLQVRRPMYRSAVGRWKRYADHLGPLLEALGRPGPPFQTERK
jgi:Flp pilus assembly protein TadD